MWPPAVTGSVKVGSQPWAVAYDATDHLAFSANAGSGTISVLTLLPPRHFPLPLPVPERSPFAARMAIVSRDPREG
jgi:DNA-binding beta-propeller fold protein YncE